MRKQMTNIVLVIIVLTLTVLSIDTYAQVVHFPDLNLRAAVAEPIGADPDHITVAALRRLTRLDAPSREIENLEGLEHASNLRLLDLASNRISDLTPLANLHNLEELGLDRNVVKDVSPLAGMINLLVLTIEYNLITDVEPLRGLTNLHVLKIEGNSIVDHSPLDGLALDIFTYDQLCDMSAEPLEPRLENRSFPSVFASFSAQIVNKDDPWAVEMPYHDMIFTGNIFADEFRVFDGEWHIIGVFPDMIDRRDRFLARNPNMIFLLEVRIFNSGGSSPPDAFPDDHPYWLRDTNGQIIVDGGYRLINYAHPDVQDIIVGQALAVAKCGLYDGVFFDHWNDSSSTVDNDLISDEDAVNARENIIRRIREGTRDNFLIVGNTNDNIIPLTGPMMNGAYMESIVPAPGVPREPSIRIVRDSLEWLENNLREPRLVLLQGGTDRSEPPDSPYNQRLMRATTTMSLTHSDGYTQFGIGSSDDKFWYDFWDADLGQPVGPKSQFYENIEGLYIREFTNGWAVYNQSGNAQMVTLPEKSQSVANGLSNTKHVVEHIDGDIFLKVKKANPADVNGDGIVNILDLTLVARGLGTDSLEGDVNGDGLVNVFDLVFVANQLE